MTHAEIGAYLLGLWGLPHPIVDAVAHHHAPDASHDRTGSIPAPPSTSPTCSSPSWEGAGTVEGPPDEDYLARLGVADQLPAWRALAARQVHE